MAANVQIVSPPVRAPVHGPQPVTGVRAAPKAASEHKAAAGDKRTVGAGQHGRAVQAQPGGKAAPEVKAAAAHGIGPAQAAPAGQLHEAGALPPFAELLAMMMAQAAPQAVLPSEESTGEAATAPAQNALVALAQGALPGQASLVPALATEPTPAIAVTAAAPATPPPLPVEFAALLRQMGQAPSAGVSARESGTAISPDEAPAALTAQPPIQAAPVEVEVPELTRGFTEPLAQMTQSLPDEAGAPIPVAPEPSDVHVELDAAPLRAEAPVVQAPQPAPEEPVPEPLRTLDPIGVERLMERIADAAVRSRDGEYSVTLRLYPEHLGEVKLQLHLNGKEVRTVLEVANPAARQQLESGGDQLRQGLDQAGLTLAGFQVSTGRGGQQLRDPDRRPEEREEQQITAAPKPAAAAIGGYSRAPGSSRLDTLA